MIASPPVPGRPGEPRAVPGRPGRPHAFRRQLPVRVRARLDAPLPQLEPEVEAANARAALRSPDVDLRRLTRKDWREFLMAYCAMFIALQVFLA
jgi:hypothetical protein